MLARIRYGRLLKSDPDLRGSPEAAQLEEAMRVSWGLGRSGLGWAAAAWPAMGCEWGGPWAGAGLQQQGQLWDVRG